MDNPSGATLRIGDWQVNVALSEISKADSTVRLDPRLMRLLLCLAERAGEIVGTEALLKAVWPEVIVTPDSVYQAIASLRRSLGDDPKNPTYVATLPRVGYRLIAPVGPIEADKLPIEEIGHTSKSQSRTGWRHKTVAFLGLAAIVTVALLFAFDYRRTQESRSTIAILPILDLTSESMDQEYFADGVTEELIERLSQTHRWRVSSASASFHYKGSHLSMPEIAQELGVNYLMDGSVRQSGSRRRVTVRLLRAQDGFVIWTKQYERNTQDHLRVQDDVAQDVTKDLEPLILGR